MRKKAAELTAGRKTDLEKLEALYDFVATNFRYVSLSLGAGRYQPRQAGAVLQDQYGDCKDKHTLLASLIDAAGLKAAAVLINMGAKIDPEFPSPSQFNHVITLAAADGKDVWVDTTSEVAPFQLLLSDLRNKQGLVVDAAKPRLQQTPANPPMKSLMLQDIDATLASDGKLDAHLRMTLRGDVELLMRTVFRSAPPAQWKEVLEGFVKGHGNAGEIANWKVSDPAALRDPFSIELDLSVARYADWTSKRITVLLPLTASSAFAADATDDDAETPVNIGAAPMDMSYKLRLALPADVSARAPVPVKLARDYAGYRADYSVAGTVLTAERLMTVQISEVPADRRQDVAAFLKVVATRRRAATVARNVRCHYLDGSAWPHRGATPSQRLRRAPGRQLRRSGDAAQARRGARAEERQGGLDQPRVSLHGAATDRRRDRRLREADRAEPVRSVCVSAISGGPTSSRATTTRPRRRSSSSSKINPLDKYTPSTPGLPLSRTS